jgi:hypothetical protein
MLGKIAVKSIWFVLLFAPVAGSQAQSIGDPLKACETHTKSRSVWYNCVTEKVVQAATLQANQRHPSRQVELPSLAENTTSLVDQTSGPDLAGLALNLAGLKGNTGSNDNGTAVAITTSAYALYAGVVQHDPLDPAFYQSHPNLRRFSFSVGHDGGEANSATQAPATLAGFKILIVNNRDVAKQKQKLAGISAALIAAGPAIGGMFDSIDAYLFKEFTMNRLTCNKDPKDVFEFVGNCLQGDALPIAIASLTPKQRQEITELISTEEIVSPLVKLHQTTADVIGKIRRAPQLSFTFQSKLRDGKGDDEYRTGVLFDYGVWDRFNLSLNGTFDYLNSRTIGGDTRAGRFAAEGIFQLTPNKFSFGDPRPWLLSAAAEAKWPNDHENTYTGQLKLTIPIPGMTGVNFPISVSVANRSDLIKEKVVRGKFGFTVDITKLLSKAP